MTEIRSRTRTPTQAPVQTQQPSLLKTGADAEALRVAEAQKQASGRSRRNAPWRLWVPFQGDEANRTREFILLDSNIADCPCFYEHALPDPNNDGKKTLHEPCIKVIDNCPLCEKYGDSYYVQMLSIMELLSTPYTTRDGQKVYHSKRLLPVKFASHDWFKNICLDTFQGNMRGAHILTTREAAQRSATIGTPRLSIDPDTQTVVRYTEEQLMQEFGHPEVKNKEGVVYKQANADLYPYNYQELFPTPTAADLRQRYGGVTPAGSTEEVQQTWGEDKPPVTPAPGGGIKRQTVASTNNGTGGEELLDPSDEIPF